MIPKDVVKMEYEQYQLVCQDCDKLRIDCECEDETVE